MSKKKFEEWWRTNQCFARLNENGEPINKGKLYNCWNHQQKKIDELEVKLYKSDTIWQSQEKQIQDLEARLEKAVEALRFLMTFAPKTKAVEGLDPTFYFTLSYEGDREIDDRLVEIKKTLEEIEKGE